VEIQARLVHAGVLRSDDRAKALGSLTEKPTEIKVQGSHTLRAYYGKLGMSCLRYTQVAARPEVVVSAGLSIPVADIETLASMKAAAVHDCGTKRDRDPASLA
jgi:hypothetical protein